MTPEQRFLAKIQEDPDTGCWIWTAHRNRAGYGRFRSESGSTMLAHRWAYRHWVDGLPDPASGLVLHHRCQRGADGCVNPHHLVWRDLSGNARDNSHARKTHCPQGHPYDDRNTYRDGRGHRRCRECARTGLRRRRSKQP